MAGILEKYRAHIKAATLDYDPAQALAIEKLQLLSNRLTVYKAPDRTDIFSYFTRNRGDVPKGLYIFGKVGRGKTMAMDMFFETVTVKRKRRIHFHEFMLDVHRRIARVRENSTGDPIRPVAKSIAAEATLLCFDELHVTDIADAMVLSRLFKKLINRGTIIVATSNAHPTALYKDGLNRQLFLPFINLIEKNLEVFELDASIDYRLGKLSAQNLYFTPSDEKSKAGMNAVWFNLTGSETGSMREHELNGRILHVPQVAMGAARFNFEDICGKPLGSEDYLTLANAYHTIFIDEIPVLTPERRNEARRFINLIDTLYDNRVKLILSAEDEPHLLYPDGTGADLFERTASRLIEMRSAEYLSAAHGSINGTKIIQTD